jgi:transcriptional regulator with XRE-family HTH domain
MDLHDYKKRIAYLIQKRLDELRLQKQEFAEMMNVQPSAVSRWLSGEHNFTIETLYNIEQKLHMSILNVYSFVRKKPATCFPVEFSSISKKTQEVNNENTP